MSFLLGIRMYSLWAAQCRATCDRACQPVKLHLSQTSRRIQLRDQHWCLPSTCIHCGEGFPAPPPWCTIHVLQKAQQEERGNLNASADCSQHFLSCLQVSSTLLARTDFGSGRAWENTLKKLTLEKRTAHPQRQPVPVVSQADPLVLPRVVQANLCVTFGGASRQVYTSSLLVLLVQR